MDQNGSNKTIAVRPLYLIYVDLSCCSCVPSAAEALQKSVWFSLSIQTARSPGHLNCLATALSSRWATHGVSCAVVSKSYVKRFKKYNSHSNSVGF